ncbi:ankyrin repeat and sterile alpha motif domain-containing protein 1B isoform X1 [Clupea harengus]|uniref:Ankyrin repeat and sterile alpha motif domain-containing protein 1B isoform X1 n=1 Tax=Clupea harengus TaxID=7950 RepID=A0A6P8GMM3_CLUHA|nr:ankyrin repeat and sterile alpha motif domain-containing protein 1B isoform X1 [Clupea harengus]
MGKEHELLEAARTGNIVLVEKLLSGKKGLLGSGSGSNHLPNLLSIWRGLNVNCADSSGYTPLHHAALNGHRDVVLKLLQFEASTNVADSNGCFPLHLAAWRGDVEIVRILIHHGPSHCRVNEQNHEKETALHCAAQYGHSDVVGVLLRELTDPSMRNRRGETPLDLAALYGRLPVVCMLVNAHPALMHSSHTRQHTPLHLAARNGHHAAASVLIETGMDVNVQTEKGSALHEAALFGKIDVVRLLLDSGIDVNIRDYQGRTALDILREHPTQKSQQIAGLIQDYILDECDRSLLEEPIRHCPIPTPRTSMSSPAASPSLRHKNDVVTGELSRLLSEIKRCRDRDYSFEELCHTISSHSMESFGSGRLSDEERNGTLGRVSKRPTPPLPPALEEEEKSCGPAGFWEALTPCNGCRNLGFPSLSQDSKRSCEIVPSPSLDVFLPEDEDNPYESVATAVTRKPCSLDVSRLHSCPRNGHSPHVTIDESELCNHGNSSCGPTPDCSPPSPDTALRNIERVIRPQPKQRTSSSQDVQPPKPPNPGYDPSEVSSSLGYASFSTSPPVSPANYSIGSGEDGTLPDETPPQRECVLRDERRESRIPEEFAGLLHGSSPACETPDTPYQLYGRANNNNAPPRYHGNLLLPPPPPSPPSAAPPTPLPRTSSDSSATSTTSKGQQPGGQQPRNEPKPQILYRTIFTTRVNQNQSDHPGPGATRAQPSPATGAHVRNGGSSSSSAGTSPSGSSGTGTGTVVASAAATTAVAGGNSSFEERACTLGRMRSVPRKVLDLQLSRSMSKSDSNLVGTSPVEEGGGGGGGRGQTSPGKGSTGGPRLERTPSFTAEWEEIDKIMSSIGAGIGTGLDEDADEDFSGPRCPLQSVGQWLDSIGLVQYENHLLANGFDNVQFMGSNVVEDQDLLEIGILNSAHRQRLLQAIRLLPRVRPIGYDGNNPTSVAEWLESLELGDYTKSFLINGYTSMELVKKIWEIELINVLKISLIGHRKRILASLGDRLHEDVPQKPPRAISLREPSGNHTPPSQLSPSLSQAAYTNAGSLDVQHLIMQADARRRRNDNYFEDVPRSKLERQMAQVSMQGEWCEPITLRPPNEATSSTPVQYWQHHPEKLIFQSCDYEAYYLGSMLVKELRGTESTQDACAKMRKSTEQMKKVPTIVLSVSYKGVKFIDATNKNIIAEHEIRNISCAAQDPEDLSTFAYITKDLKSSHHYCHVFTAFDVNLAYEIILTLGQAFEVAYQLALQARKSGHGSSTLPESFDSKPAKPVPKPRVNIRKSMEQPSMDQKGHANVPWIVEPNQEAKRGANTKTMADAHVYYSGMQRM